MQNQMHQRLRVLTRSSSCSRVMAIGICIELGIATQCLGNALVVVVKDRREGAEQVGCKDCPLGIGQVKSSLALASASGALRRRHQFRYGATKTR